MNPSSPKSTPLKNHKIYSLETGSMRCDSHPARKNETYVELDPGRETRDATRHADPSLVLSARISLTNVPGTSIHEAPGVVDRAQKGAGGDAHREIKGPARNSRSFVSGHSAVLRSPLPPIFHPFPPPVRRASFHFFPSLAFFRLANAN